MLTSSRTTPSAIRVAHIEKRRGVRLAAFLVGHKLLLVRQHSVAAILHLAQRFWLRSSEGSRGITGYPQGSAPHRKVKPPGKGQVDAAGTEFGRAGSLRNCKPGKISRR